MDTRRACRRREMSSWLRQIIDSSVVMRVGRRVSSDSLLCRAILRVHRAAQRAEQGVAVGLGRPWRREDERRSTAQISALLEESSLLAILRSIARAPFAAPRDAKARQLLIPILDASLATTMFLTGVAIIVAVLTHCVLSALIGLRIDAIGWSARLGVAAVGLLAVWRPDAAAAAWKDRKVRLTTEDRA